MKNTLLSGTIGYAHLLRMSLLQRRNKQTSPISMVQCDSAYGGGLFHGCQGHLFSCAQSLPGSINLLRHQLEFE